MTDLRSEMRDKWREAELTGKGDREWRGIALSVQGPLRLLAGIREPDGRIALLLEAPMTAAPRLPLRLRADGVSLADQRRPDEGIYRVALTLEHEELRDVFEVLAADILDVVRLTSNAIAAIAETTKRLETWQACLRSRRQGLSREEQIGLMGELTVLRFVATRIGYPLAISSWEGPLDGIHDFTCVGIALEVKTALGSGGFLHVSNLAQLESSGFDALVIVRVRFREGPDGKSIPDAVQEIRKEIKDAAPSTISSIDEKLLRMGYLDLDRDLHGALRFVPVDLYGITVRDGFPRLTPSLVPAGIVDGSYMIDERATADFRIKLDDLQKFVDRMTGEKS
jgi:Putative  PD-(D/E)XK family member, (DUF4420)